MWRFAEAAAVGDGCGGACFEIDKAASPLSRVRQKHKVTEVDLDEDEDEDDEDEALEDDEEGEGFVAEEALEAHEDDA